MRNYEYDKCYLSQTSDTVDSTPIKLHTAPDSVHSRPYHHDVAPWEGYVIL